MAGASFLCYRSHSVRCFTASALPAHSTLFAIVARNVQSQHRVDVCLSPISMSLLFRLRSSFGSRAYQDTALSHRQRLLRLQATREWLWDRSRRQSCLLGRVCLLQTWGTRAEPRTRSCRRRGGRGSLGGTWQTMSLMGSK